MKTFMSKTCICLFVFLSAFLSGCDEHDDVKLASLADVLYQAVWNATETVYNEDGSIALQDTYIFQFLSESRGEIVERDDSGNLAWTSEFDYEIHDNIVTFKGGWVGQWLVVEYTHDKVILQTYSPQKYVLTLERQK